MPRVLKLDPDRDRRLICAPLNPPRETSYGEVMTELDTIASRGRLDPPNCIPLSVVLFWSAPSPSTEYPSALPSCPGTDCTPGRDAAIAARSPMRLAGTAVLVSGRSVPLTSWGASF